MKLNLGCAKDIREGYINVDLHYKHPDVVNEDISNISFVQNNSVEKIIAKDIIEHLPLDEALRCLKIWYDYLQPGGKMFLQTTNFTKIKEAFSQKIWDVPTLNHMLFAGTGYVDAGNQECDFHKSVYTTEFLSNALTQIGFKILGIQEDEIDDPLKSNPRAHNLNVTFVIQK
jgi:predicted SAM-dependent methyltransferase